MWLEDATHFIIIISERVRNNEFLTLKRGFFHICLLAQPRRGDRDDRVSEARVENQDSDD